MSAITRVEAQEWANRLQATRRARHKSKTVTSDDEDVSLLGAETVCAAVHLISQLYDAAGESGARWRTLIELGTEVGLRPGELYGLHGHRVDWLRGKVQVIDVMTRSGLRQWPEIREVPPRRARSRAHPRGHIRADDRTAA